MTLKITWQDLNEGKRISALCSSEKHQRADRPDQYWSCKGKGYDTATHKFFTCECVCHPKGEPGSFYTSSKTDSKITHKVILNSVQEIQRAH